ncbi:MAG: peptidylprolyl isomerase [Kiritimatiellaeota bacterium]|nr:peptidylprolyl isomerase [Kiritimatiellota bacterium]
MKCLPLFCIALAITFAVTTGCKKQEEDRAVKATGDPNEVVASVDGVNYLRKDMDERINLVMDANNIPEEHRDEVLPRIENELINTFINKTLLINEAKKLGITVTDEDRKTTEAIFEKRLQQERPNMTLDQYFQLSPFGEETARKDFADGLLFEKLFQDVLGSTIEVSEEEIAQVAANVKEQIAQVEAANKAALESKPIARAKLEDIKKQLDAGADFAELAKAHSDCPTSKEGGALGTFSRERMVKPFEDAAFSQEVGKVGDIVETQYGYHLILVTEKNPAVEATADAPATPETVAASHILVKTDPQHPIRPIPSTEEIRTSLKGQKIKDVVPDYVQELKAKATIESILPATPTDE